MTLAECRQLNRSDKIVANLTSGMKIHGRFLRLVSCSEFRKVTLEDLLSGNFHPTGTRKVVLVRMEYTNEKGKKTYLDVNPRRIMKDE